MSDRFEGLRRLAPFLNELRPDPLARLGYELMSDALIWTDELPLPDERSRLELDTNCMRGVFRYRTTIMQGSPDERYRESWEEARRLCPNWPGFLPDRGKQDPSRIELYKESSARLNAEFDALDERFQLAEAQKKEQSEAAVR